MINPGVRVLGIRPEMVLALSIAQQVYDRHGWVEFVITSAIEKTHQRASLHYTGSAVDLRRPENAVQAAELGKALRDALGDDYDVVVEVGCIHLEFQPKAPY